MKPNRLGRFCLGVKIALLIMICALAVCRGLEGGRAGDDQNDSGALPSPEIERGLPLNKVLSARRSVRRFAARTLTAREIGQLLWAGQGTTSAQGFRTAPSAGAIYPLEIHLATAKGVFRYDPQRHRIERLVTGDKRRELAQASLGQTWVSHAAAVFVVAGVVSRTRSRYGARAERYVVFEAGAAVENLLLEAVSLGLGAVVVGAYHDAKVSAIAALPEGSVPLAIVPVGEPIF